MAEEVIAAEGQAVEGTPVSEATNAETASTEVGAESNAASSAEQAAELYTVLVGGEERQVTLDDALKGWMRNEDYTRKTQEVAAEKTRLAQLDNLAKALEADPKGTLTALARALNVDLATAAAVVSEATDGEVDPIESLRQEVAKLNQGFQTRVQAEEQERRTAQAREAAETHIRQTIAELKGQYGEFDDQALVGYMIERGETNIQQAYRAWQFDQNRAKEIAERNQATEAKRKAQVVEGGSNPQAGAIAPGTAGRKPTFREALNQALASHR